MRNCWNNCYEGVGDGQNGTIEIYDKPFHVPKDQIILNTIKEKELGVGRILLSMSTPVFIYHFSFISFSLSLLLSIFTFIRVDPVSLSNNECRHNRFGFLGGFTFNELVCIVYIFFLCCLLFFWLCHCFHIKRAQQRVLSKTKNRYESVYNVF